MHLFKKLISYSKKNLLAEIETITAQRDNWANKYSELSKKYKSLREKYQIQVLKNKEQSQKIKDLSGKYKEQSKYKFFSGISNRDGSFKKFFIENNMPAAIANLKANLDSESQKVIDDTIEKMLYIPDRKHRHFYRMDKEIAKEFLEFPYEKEADRICSESIESWKEKYVLQEGSYDLEVLYKHHGLSGIGQKIKDYIKNKDFIDGGAYVGDSALVFFEYEPKKVYSFEMSPKNSQNYYKTMNDNHIDFEKYEFVNLGISDGKYEFSINDTGENGASLTDSGNTLVHTTDIDSYVFENNLDVGFIKTDVEGAGLLALKGMEKTIRKFRPVLSLAIYHTPEEFFETKPYLENIVKDLNYKIRIEKHNSVFHTISGVVLMAYPAELEV